MPVDLSEFPRLAWNANVSTNSPVVKGTFVTAAIIVALIVDGWQWDDILNAHPEITVDDIRQALKYTCRKDKMNAAPVPVTEKKPRYTYRFNTDMWEVGQEVACGGWYLDGIYADERKAICRTELLNGWLDERDLSTHTKDTPTPFVADITLCTDQIREAVRQYVERQGFTVASMILFGDGNFSFGDIQAEFQARKDTP